MAYHQYSAWSHNYAYEHDGGNDITVTDHNHICVNVKISRRVYFQQNWKFFYQQINRFTHALLQMFTFYVPCINVLFLDFKNVNKSNNFFKLLVMIQ